MSNEFIGMAYDALDMFVFLAAELIVLFLAISYLVGVLQEFLTPEKIQAILSSRKGKGYFIAALLGSITPFCSCSTIPFLKGLLRARAGFGPMMVFLFASPLLNPVIIGLFFITFGWQVALFYFAVALSVSVASGYLLEKLGFERYIKPEAYQFHEASGCTTNSNNEQSSCSSVETSSTTSCCSQLEPATKVKEVSCCSKVEATKIKEAKIKPQFKVAVTSDSSSCCSGNTTETLPESKSVSRWMRIWLSTWKDFKQVLPYLILGIAIGSFIYGFIPTEFIVEYAGTNKWYAIPVAAVIGIPLYIRAEAVIPLSAALVEKREWL